MIPIPILKATELSKRFSEPIEVSVLDKISLEVFPGETVAIVGKSGEGKTTLLHLLGALEEPSSGTVEICGEQMAAHKKNLLRNKHMGFIFQAYHLLEEFTVLENVLMPARIAKQDTRPGSPAYKRALDLLEDVSLSHRAFFLAKLLSGGEKQRVAVARALINHPSLLLADEPSGNLDHDTSQAIYTLLLESAKKQGAALIVVTHDTEFASRCQKMYTLQGGRLA